MKKMGISIVYYSDSSGKIIKQRIGEIVSYETAGTLWKYGKRGSNS